MRMPSFSCSTVSIRLLLMAFGMVSMGTLLALSAKVQGDITSVGKDGKIHNFNHPWVQSFLMFFGQSLCLFVFMVLRLVQKYRKKQMEEPPTPIFSFIFLFPTICDVVASVMSMVGLMLIEPSIWQMLRGARIFFSAFLSIIFLGRHLVQHHWIGIGTVFLGIIFVGISQYFASQTSSTPTSNILIGIAATLVAQVFESVQMILEEVLLQNKHYHPLNVVGMEGMWGILLVGLIFLPALYFVPVSKSESILVECFHEDSIDAIIQIKNSWLLQLFVILFVLSVGLFAFFAVSVVKHLSTIHRTLLDTFRTIGIWGIGTLLYYGFGLVDYGEALTYWSLLQAGGFCLLLLGSFIYNEILILPFVVYKRQNVESEEKGLLSEKNKPINT